MTDATITLVAAFGGVLAGAAASLATSVLLHRLRRRDAEDYEVRIRILNSYQDFVNAARKMLAFQQDGPRRLWEEALAEAHKCVNDAHVFDPTSSDRVRAMKALLDHLAATPELDDVARRSLDARIAAVFEDYWRDRKLSFWRRIG